MVPAMAVPCKQEQKHGNSAPSDDEGSLSAPSATSSISSLPQGKKVDASRSAQINYYLSQGVPTMPESIKRRLEIIDQGPNAKKKKGEIISEWIKHDSWVSPFFQAMKTINETTESKKFSPWVCWDEYQKREGPTVANIAWEGRHTAGKLIWRLNPKISKLEDHPGVDERDLCQFKYTEESTTHAQASVSSTSMSEKHRMTPDEGNKLSNKMSDMANDIASGSIASATGSVKRKQDKPKDESED